MDPDLRAAQMILDAYSSAEGSRRLEGLGLDVPTIHDVLLYGQAERDTYTDFDARGAGEYARWSRQVRRLSEKYVPRGWTRINPDNQPTIVHPSNRHCVVVAGGNSLTGIRFGNPTTKNPRGRTFRDAVGGNAVLFDLEDIEPVLGGLKETWILLTFASPDGKLYSEVSLPNGMTGDYISGWQERILVPPFDPQGGIHNAGEEEPPSYDFAISRK